jgi:peptidoglycan/xylan/chitin deacetylase (PgdA/CDA1 family)
MVEKSKNYSLVKMLIVFFAVLAVAGGLYYLSIRLNIFDSQNSSNDIQESLADNKNINSNDNSNKNFNINLNSNFVISDREIADDRYLATLPVKSIEKGATRVPVLLYHHISNISPDKPEGERSYFVSPEIFARQMAWLAENNYSVISLSRLTNYLKTGKNKPPSRSVVITFDDGTAGEYEYAYPILRYYNFTATFFIVPKWAEEADQKQKVGYMNWAEIKELSLNGMEIGSHAMTHKTLTEATDSELAYEITESKKILEEKTGGIISLFAYPGGSNNINAINNVIAAGYAGACSVDKRIDHKSDQVYTLGRMHIDDDMPYFKARVEGRWQR